MDAAQHRFPDAQRAAEASASANSEEAGRSPRHADRELFARELREFLRKAGIRDPDYVYDARGYRIIGPLDQRLLDFGQDSRERLAVKWLLTYQQVRKYEAQIAAAREGRRAPPQFDLPEQPSEQEWIADKLRQLKELISETKVNKPRSGRRVRREATSERPRQDELQARRDEARDRYNRERKAEAEARTAQAQALADDLWRDNPKLASSKVAKEIAPKLIERWHTENERRERDGKGPSRLPQPNAETIRRYLKRPL